MKVLNCQSLTGIYSHMMRKKKKQNCPAILTIKFFSVTSIPDINAQSFAAVNKAL